MILLSVPAIADDQKKSESKTVDFLAENGVFIKKEFYDLSKVKTIEFQVLVLSNLMNDTKMGCLRLKTKEYKTYSTQSYTGTLDSDEIDACLQCLNMLKDKVILSTPTVYTETEYKTRDGVKIGAYFDLSKNKWTTYVQTKSYTDNSLVFVDTDNIPEIISRLEEAKRIIKENVK